MRPTILFRLITLALLFGSPSLRLPAQDQSAGDVAAAARKAREQQKASPKPAKVFTNDDFPAVNTNASPSTPAEASAENKKEGTLNTQEKDLENDPKSEVYWRKRFQKIHDRIATAEKELDVLQRELNVNQVQYYPDPQKTLAQEYTRADIQEKTVKIDAKKKEIESLKQELSNLQDDLRKAGGDPGWAR